MRLSRIAAVLGICLSLDPAPVYPAGRPPEGGTLVVYTYGAPARLEPARIRTATDALLSASVHEPLVRSGTRGEIQPVLVTKLPSIDSTTVELELGPDLVSSDGRLFSAEEIASWLRSLAKLRGPASHIVMPLRGVRELWSGQADAPLSIEASPDGRVLRLELVHPYDSLLRLWSSPRAAVSVPGRQVATGPWVQIRKTDELVFEPNRFHREGRPFLDKLSVRSLSSRFGISSLLRKEPSALFIGMPLAESQAGSVREHRVVQGPEEIIVLAVGSRARALRSREALERIGAAFDRRRLAGRHLPGFQALETFVPGLATPKDPGGRAADHLGRARLLVAKDSVIPKAFIERIQLDLMDIGLTATVERPIQELLDERLRRGDFDLILETMMPDAPLRSRPEDPDAFHSLLSVAAYFSDLAALPEAVWKGFAVTVPADRARAVQSLDEHLRFATGLVPLAVGSASLAIPEGVARLEDPDGWRLRFEDAHLKPPGGPPP